jgi:hypothetical protein
MSEWLDSIFIAKVMPYLDKAKPTANGVQARCPSCGDSQKNQYKRRFGILKSPDGAYCHCFNCDYSNTFSGFLKEFFPDLYSEYIKEIFLEKGGQSQTQPKKTVSKTRLSKQKNALFTESSADEVHEKKSGLLKSLKSDNKALVYIKSRKIRDSLLKEIFVTDDYNQLLSAVRYDTEKNKVPSDKRIVIPLTKKDKSFGGFIGRVITDPKFKDKDSLRYSKNTFSDEAIWIPKDIDTSKPIWVFEGFFDAALFENSIAVLSSNLQLARDFFPESELVYFPDNEPDKTEIMTKLKRLIKKDTKAKFFIPNKELSSKDISHEVVDVGRDIDDVYEYLKSRIFSYPRNSLEFNIWTNGNYLNA